jgi:hypothetical protein
MNQNLILLINKKLNMKQEKDYLRMNILQQK